MMQENNIHNMELIEADEKPVKEDSQTIIFNRTERWKVSKQSLLDQRKVLEIQIKECVNLIAEIDVLLMMLE